ncbi:MAG TPA: dihydrolipoamide acetyltransferase family protein, partial [Burkholderiales bacterium]|nr:dihydrolipoamide acetyltransferase family protein [Burkholderiales bacterium]
MDVVMPQLGETVAEGTVIKWHKKVGDAIKADEALFDVETDKVSTEIPAPASGVLAEILVAEGTTAKVGTRLAVIRESAQAAHAAAPAQADIPATPAVRTLGAPPERLPPSSAAGRLSPVVSRLIAEHGLDARAITGTGRDGRITREDVLAHVAQGGVAQPAVRTQEPARYAIAGTETVPLTIIRKRTAEHMAKSWTTVPHVLQAVEADFSRVDQARRMTGEQWKKREGYSLTYLPFIACAVAAALIKYPRLNASFSGDHLVLYRRVNLGIAVDLNLEGLLVPVVKDASAKSLPELARAINDVAVRARENRLRPDDMTEGTYTITNNGASGTLITAPIINPPQVAVLSTDAVRKRTVVIESAGRDEIAVRPVGVLAQSFDHRAVDGAYSAAFLNEVKTLIETRDWQNELRDG